MALVMGAAPTARAQQKDSTRTTSTRRIRVTKDRPSTPAPSPARAPVAASRVNQDSVAAAERARQDSIAAAERDRQEQRARMEQMRRDSIEVAERHRQDSIAAVDAARQDSIARAQQRAQSRNALDVARSRNSGFYMAVAGGSTMPMGNIKTAVNDSYDAGWNVTVPFGWDFAHFPLGLRFDIAMDNLTARGNFVDASSNPVMGHNLAIYSGSAGLKLNVPLFRTASRFYLIGGAGAHRITGYWTNATLTDSAQTIQNAKTDIGWYGGAGINLRFGRTAFFVESRYINIDVKQPPAGFAFQKANYLPVVLGIQF
jgi:hypothetical protein